MLFMIHHMVDLPSLLYEEERPAMDGDGDGDGRRGRAEEQARVDEGRREITVGRMHGCMVLL